MALPSIEPILRTEGSGAGPLYRRAASVLRTAIASGQLTPGTALPAEGALAGQFDVSLITVRQALRELETEGLISKRSGRPAVVTDGVSRTGRAMNTLEDVIASTADARLEIFSYGQRRGGEAAVALGLEPGTPCHRLHGRLSASGLPLAEITIHFPPAIGARLRRQDFDDVVVFRSVERHLGIRLSGAAVTVAAELADRRLGQLLGVPEGAAVLTNTMLYRDGGGAPVEFTVARHRGDRYRFSYELGA